MGFCRDTKGNGIPTLRICALDKVEGLTTSVRPHRPKKKTVKEPLCRGKKQPAGPYRKRVADISEKIKNGEGGLEQNLKKIQEELTAALPRKGRGVVKEGVRP